MYRLDVGFSKMLVGPIQSWRAVMRALISGHHLKLIYPLLFLLAQPKKRESVLAPAGRKSNSHKNLHRKARYSQTVLIERSKCQHLKGEVSILSFIRKLARERFAQPDQLYVIHSYAALD
ncbi:hypothetical protein DND90_21475 [Pseudomonas syringae pv. maculicola]|nr:hypothetical protein DND90_21475 [Pseudomonas syringae pv. maculicola]